MTVAPHTFPPPRTLGRTELRPDGLGSAPVARDLFLYLLSRPEGASKADIYAALWDAEVDAKSNNRFRVTHHRLDVACGRPTLVEDHGTYHLHPELAEGADVRAFEAALDAARLAARRVEKIRALRLAVDLYGGDFLPGHPAEWAQEARERLRAAYANACVELAVLHCDDAHCAPAVLHLTRALRTDPYLGENYHQNLIACLGALEGRDEAVTHYREFLRFLRDDLGDTPMADTVRLAERVKAGDAVCPRHIGSALPCTRRLLLRQDPPDPQQAAETALAVADDLQRVASPDVLPAALLDRLGPILGAREVTVDLGDGRAWTAGTADAHAARWTEEVGRSGGRFVLLAVSRHAERAGWAPWERALLARVVRSVAAAADRIAP